MERNADMLVRSARIKIEHEMRQLSNRPCGMETGGSGGAAPRVRNLVFRLRRVVCFTVPSVEKETGWAQ
jgi:hypothetical protein